MRLPIQKGWLKQILKKNNLWCLHIFLAAVLAITILILTSQDPYNSRISDPYYHSRVADLIKKGFFPKDYSPFSDTELTYPLFLHYLTYFTYLITNNTLLSFQVIGVLSFVALQISILFLLREHLAKRVSILFFSSMMILLNLQPIIVFIYAEYPQLLAMAFMNFSIYYYLKGRKHLAGALFGLCLLTHVFVPLFLGFALFICELVELYTTKDKNMTKQLIQSVKSLSIAYLIGLAISIAWLPRYFKIISNAANSNWNNVVWYIDKRFIGLEEILKLIYEFNPVFFILTCIFAILIAFKYAPSSYASKHKDKLVFCILFLVTFILTIYRLRYAQSKMKDIFSIFYIILAVMSVNHYSSYRFFDKTKNYIIANMALGFSVLVSFLMVAATVIVFLPANVSPLNEIEVYFIKNHLENQTVLVENIESCYSNCESIFAYRTNNLPLNLMITDLEKYSDSYKKQLSYRKMALETGNLSNSNISYIIANKCSKYVVPTNWIIFNVKNYSKLNICKVLKT